MSEQDILPEIKFDQTFTHLYPEFKHLSPEAIDEQYAEVYDRWIWDTGTKEDRELLEKLDIERHYRKKNKGGRKLEANWIIGEYGLDAEEEIVKAMAEEITKEIDQEILRSLKNE